MRRYIISLLLVLLPLVAGAAVSCFGDGRQEAGDGQRLQGNLEDVRQETGDGQKLQDNWQANVSLLSPASSLQESNHKPQPSTLNPQIEEPQNDRFDHRVHRVRHYWANLIPTQVVVQNAGNMGLVSAGIGWEYGRRTQWETHLLWGFIPKYGSTKAHMTSTLKQNYIPWSISFNDWLALEPLEATLYVNTVYGHEFWRSQPGRYPDKYYEALSTKFRLNVGFGQRLTLTLNPDKYYFRGVTFFYEVSSCDLYIRALVQGTAISFWDTVGLSLGVKLQLL